MALNQTQIINNLAFIQYIKYRVTNNNQNFVAVFIGKTGSGKSWSSLALAEMLDSSFNIKQVCADVGTFYKLTDELPKGSVIDFDELGASMGSRDWYSVQNKMMSQMMQTQRSQNLITFFTVPSLSMIDSHARVLAHCIIETVKINRENNWVQCKVKMINQDHHTGRVYTPFITYHSNGKKMVLKYVYIPKPTIILQHSYENFKLDFNKSIRDDAIMSAELVGKKGGFSDLAKKIITLHMSNPDFTQVQIAEQISCSQVTVSRILEMFKPSFRGNVNKAYIKKDGANNGNNSTDTKSSHNLVRTIF